MKHLNSKLYYQKLHFKYWCNLARYWLQAVWGWHDSVETCSSVIICEIIVHLLVMVQNNLINNYGTYKTYIYYLKYNLGKKVYYMQVLSRGVWGNVLLFIGGHQCLGGTSCLHLHVRSKQGTKMVLSVQWNSIVGESLLTYFLTPWISVPLKKLTGFNPLNLELNPMCCLLALLGAHHFLHVIRIRVKLLTFRLLMSCIYGAPILDVSRSHTTTQHSR